jgi:hypothetical protein
MPIIVTDDPEVRCTKEELTRWTDEYQRRFMMFSGTPPTLAEFIRRERTRKPLGIVSSSND